LLPILSQIDPVDTIPSYRFLLRYIFILSTHLRLDLPSCLYPSSFSTNILHAFSSPPIRATCTAHIILLDLIILIMFGEEYNYVAPRYAVSSNLPSLHLSSIQIFSSVPCSETPAVYVPSLMLKIKFRTRTEPHAKLVHKM
jgi:hypothetical protein